MKEKETWWVKSGQMLATHPELVAAARGVFGFGGGARWMHQAMVVMGWRMPPFRGFEIYARMGWLKYGICSAVAVLGVMGAYFCGWVWMAPLVAVVAFYAAEAQMVFLFPEALLGRRSPWASARALTVSAGGTWRVMREILPIATRMLATGWYRGRGKETWLQGCLAVVIWHRSVASGRVGWVDDVSVLPCGEIGPVAPLLIRREQVRLPGRGTFRVLWISDLHWRGAGDGGTLLALRDLARCEQPDVCILGGDFIENSRALPLFSLLIRCLARVAPCVALPGNHDQGHFLNGVRNAILKGRGHWLPDTGKMELTNSLGDRLDIVMRDAPESSQGVKRVIAVHDPAELYGSPIARGSLVLAGHLHGGQWVFSSKSGRLLPANWFYKNAWLRRTHRVAEWIISRGAGDTFPLRWNCPREVILCEIL